MQKSRPRWHSTILTGPFFYRDFVLQNRERRGSFAFVLIRLAESMSDIDL